MLPEGPLSPRLAALERDDSVWLLDRANGFFCVAELPDAAALWCLATGTGLGPYLSILRTEEPWEKFERVVLVHAVRHAEDLSYGELIASLVAARPGRFTFAPFVSRETRKGALPGRIPDAILDGRLEAWTGVPLTRTTRTRCYAAIPTWCGRRKACLSSAACDGIGAASPGISPWRRIGSGGKDPELPAGRRPALSTPDSGSPQIVLSRTAVGARRVEDGARRVRSHSFRS